MPVAHMQNRRQSLTRLAHRMPQARPFSQHSQVIPGGERGGPSLRFCGTTNVVVDVHAEGDLRPGDNTDKALRTDGNDTPWGGWRTPA